MLEYYLLKINCYMLNMYLELLKAVIYILGTCVCTENCGRWALGTSLSCIRPFHFIVENVRHSCLLQTTLHVLSVVAEFGSLIEI